MMLALNFLLLTMLLICAIAVIRMRSLFGATMVMSIYSLLMAIVWYEMQAMDVAFTEAAVGAGITTVLLIGTIVYTGRDEKITIGVHWPALAICVAIAALLFYAAQDMPIFGTLDAPIHRYVMSEYVTQSARSGVPYGDMGTHVPNQVTAILASYRGYDTMFEAAVIFTAGISLILLRGNPRAAGRLFHRHGDTPPASPPPPTRREDGEA